MKTIKEMPEHSWPREKLREKAKKDERLKEIKELVVSFCVEHLNEELKSYVLRLCDTLNRKRKIAVDKKKKKKEQDRQLSLFDGS